VVSVSESVLCISFSTLETYAIFLTIPPPTLRAFSAFVIFVRVFRPKAAGDSSWKVVASGSGTCSPNA